MGRRRKIIQGDFSPKSNGDGFLDVVVLGVKAFYVEQIDGKWPPYAEVVASRVINRDPSMQDDGNRLAWAVAKAARPMINPARPGFKYCSACAEWVSADRFSPKMDNADKLHSYCRVCRNEHARRMYWFNKQGVAKRAA